jgi:hypothetical protein
MIVLLFISRRNKIVLLREWQHSLSDLPHRPLVDDSLSLGHWLLITQKPPSRLQASVVALVRLATLERSATTASAKNNHILFVLKIRRGDTMSLETQKRRTNNF